MRYRLVNGRIELASDGAIMPSTVAQAFAESVRRFGTRLAIQPVQGDAITYAELGRRVRTAVAVLNRLGLACGDRLAICLPNGIDWAVFTYAAAVMGACVVPVNIRFRPDELAYVLKGSQARILVTQAAFMTNDLVARLRDIAGGALGQGEASRIDALPDLDHVVFVDGTSEPGSIDYRSIQQLIGPGPDLDQMARERRGDEPMWLFWTSGTTSAPKGALLPNSSIEMIWRWTLLAGYEADDRVLTARPLFYIAGHFWTLIGPMLYGAMSVISDELSAEQMQAQCKRHAVTVLNGNPLMMKDIIERGQFDPQAFAHLRTGHFGGFSIPADGMRRIKATLGYRQLIQTYGMTEFAGFVLSTLPDDPIEVACESCGYPFTDVELALIDPDTGHQVADGEVGMMVTRGQKLIHYVNLPEESRARLFGSDGWYRTGDLMRRLPDGRYQFVGRSKDLIKVNGENVTAAEIESVLMTHPGISLASVVGLADRERGEVPIAFVEPRTSAQIDSAELRQWCRSRMAPYKVPAEFYPVTAEQWPKTVSGKIAKHLLTPAYAAGLAA